MNELGATLHRWEDIPKTELKPGLHRRFISTERMMVTHLCPPRQDWLDGTDSYLR